MRILLALCLLWVGNVYAETIDINAIIIKASRSETALGAMNKPVVLITAEDIAHSPAKSLPELLGTKAGIHGVQYGSRKGSQVDIRGFGEASISNVVVLVDGRRTNQIDLSGQDWAQIDINLIERVEIIKGAGTVLYGDNASGGVINIVSKSGKKNTKPAVSLSSEFSRYQTAKYALDLNGGLNLIDYQFNFAHEDTTGFRANSNYWANDSNSKIGFDPNDSFGIDFAQGYHLDRYQLPGALFISNIQQLGRTGVRPTLNNDHGWTSDSHFDVTPHLKFDLGPSDGEFSLFTSARKRGNKFFTGTTVYETNYETNSYEFQPKVVVATPLSDMLGNKVTGGYDYFYAKNMRRSGNLGPSQDLLYASKVTHGVYLLDELTIDEQWLLNAGVRGAWAQYVFDQKQQAAGKSTRRPTTEGYEGGLGYKYNPNSKVYVNYTHSYRLPAIDEFFQNIYTGFGGGGGLNTALTYQVGNQYEWGVRDNTFKDVKMGANFFASQFKDEIYYDPNSYNNTNYNGRTRHYGVETQAAVELLDGKVEPFINVTFQGANFRGGTYGGNNIPFVPDQMANAGVTFKPIERLSITLSVNEVGKRFAISDQANTQPKLKRYTTADWSTTYSLKDMDISLSMRNILDSKYYNYGAYSSGNGAVGYYPAPGRDVSVGVKVRF